MRPFLTDRPVAGNLCLLPEPESHYIPSPVLQEIDGNDFTIRSFRIDTDMDMAYAWLRSEFPNNRWEDQGPIAQIRKSYQLMQQSDFSQAYTILCNDIPLCVAEIYNALYYDMSVYYPVSAGDYVIKLLFAADLDDPAKQKAALLEACLRYCFLFPEVKTVFCEQDVRAVTFINTLKENAFQLRKTQFTSYAKQHLYACSAQAFHRHFD